MRIKFYSVFLVVGLLIFTVKGFSQSGPYGNNVMTEKPNTPISEMVNGYIEVLPVSYASNLTKKYPLLIFLEGVGQFGDGSTSTRFGLPLLYGQNEGMLPDIVRKNLFPNNYTVGGTTYEFILIIPQIRRQVQNGRLSPEQMASPTEVNDIVNYAFQNYRVDEQRVYLSGLSLGGGSTWNYAGQSTTYANRLAAIVPFSGASNLHDNPSRATNIANSNLPVWTFTGGPNDEPYTTLAQDYIDTLKASVLPAHTAQELFTTYTDVGHNSWQRPLEAGNTLSGGNTGGTSNPSNIYVWMLGKTRSSATQPVFATVNAGSDQTLNLSDGSMALTSTGISFTGASVTLSGTLAAAAGKTLSNYTYTWVKVNGNGGTITNPNSLSTTVTGLKPGLYSFQLRATDDAGLATVDAVNITINPPPENKYMKVEAEAYTTSAPEISLNIAAVDQGPAISVGSFDYYTAPNPPRPPKYVEYSSLSLPAGTGVYALYYRYNSPYNSPVIQISVNGTVEATKTLVSDGAWRSDSIHLNLSTTPVTIRFTQSSSTSVNSPWEFNYFELAQINTVVLPLKFIYFNSQCSGGAVALQWRTAQEVNTQSFEVQRSTDGVRWNSIGTVAAAGQSTLERSYQYSDNTVSSSTNNFYRIVEHDLDGRTTVSSIVRASCSSNRNEFSVSPNPSTGNSALNVSLERATKITLTIVDSKGSLMQQIQLMLPQGNSSLPLNMSNYAQGIYNINIRYNDEMKTIKVVRK